MKPKAICYWLIFVLAAGMMACGGDDADTEAPAAQTPTATSSQPAEPTVTFERNIDFAAKRQRFANFTQSTPSPTENRMLTR